MEANYSQTADGPADYSFAITPNNDNDLTRVTRAIKATGAGTVAWHNRDGEAQSITVAADQWTPIRARRILVTGTTATGIEGLA